MKQRLRASLGWGLVGGLSFLVSAQAYRLLSGGTIGYPSMAGIAIIVTILSAIIVDGISQFLASR